MIRKSNFLKWSQLLLVICLSVLSFGPFAGEAEASTIERIVIATAGTTGMYYPQGGALSSIISNSVTGVDATVLVTQGSVENVRIIDQKEADIAFMMGNIADFAFQGQEVFKDEPVTSLRAIMSLVPEPQQHIVWADSGIYSLDDLKGKTVAVGAPGSGNEINSRFLLGLRGITYKDINPRFLSIPEMSAHLKDRLIDAMLFTTGLGSGAIQEVAALGEIRLLSMKEDEISEAVKNYPFFAPFSIPANTYRGQEEEVRTVATLSILVVKEDMAEEMVFQITKAIFENLQTLKDAHAMGTFISRERALDGIGIPLHDGAKKYYKEVGMIKE